MKNILILSFLFLSFSVHALISEVVYVEAPTDTDGDGTKDRIYVSISRPESDKKIPSVLEMSPYAMGPNSVNFHNVDSSLLPQDEAIQNLFNFSFSAKKLNLVESISINQSVFLHAKLKAHSLGTGRSTGCPTIGDEAEILGGKAVIDWLGGRARGFDESGREVRADWSSGSVGMTGVSYNGTLPIMVASTGVEGLKAIVPIAAISNWYDYYRANGLVVNPGGYVGEDADVLGYYVVTRGRCQNEMRILTQTQGREHGDFTPFWAARNHLANAKKFKAATFIVHGQSDWNVKQKHAIQLWEALEGVVPRKMILHRGGHGVGSAFNVTKKIDDWFAHFLGGIDNGVTDGPQVEIQHLDASQSVQENWPHERARKERSYFGPGLTLRGEAPEVSTLSFTDMGKTKKLEALIGRPDEASDGRLFFLTPEQNSDRIITGTSRVSLRMAVKNRRAANITVALVYYNRFGKRTMITRGWVDPQNHRNMRTGEKLLPGKFYDVVFDLEPKQQKLERGSRLGVLVTSTDYEYTLRPDPGTVIDVELGPKSFIDLWLTPGE